MLGRVWDGLHLVYPWCPRRCRWTLRRKWYWAWLARDVDVSVEFFPDGLRIRVVLGAFHDFPVTVHLGAMNVADDHVGITAITVRTGCADRSSEVGGP